MPQGSQEKFPRAVVKLKDCFVPTKAARESVRRGYGLNVELVTAKGDAQYPTLVFTHVEDGHVVTPEGLENSVKVVLDLLDVGPWAYTLELLIGAAQETEDALKS